MYYYACPSGYICAYEMNNYNCVFVSKEQIHQGGIISLKVINDKQFVTCSVDQFVSIETIEE